MPHNMLPTPCIFQASARMPANTTTQGKTCTLQSMEYFTYCSDTVKEVRTLIQLLLQPSQHMVTAEQPFQNDQEQDIRQSPREESEGDTQSSTTEGSSSTSRQSMNELENSRIPTVDEGANADDEASQYIQDPSTNLLVRFPTVLWLRL
jgi:hypothetical protein